MQTRRLVGTGLLLAWQVGLAKTMERGEGQQFVFSFSGVLAEGCKFAMSRRDVEGRSVFCCYSSHGGEESICHPDQDDDCRKPEGYVVKEEFGEKSSVGNCSLELVGGVRVGDEGHYTASMLGTTEHFDIRLEESSGTLQIAIGLTSVFGFLFVFYAIALCQCRSRIMFYLKEIEVEKQKLDNSGELDNLSNDICKIKSEQTEETQSTAEKNCVMKVTRVDQEHQKQIETEEKDNIEEQKQIGDDYEQAEEYQEQTEEPADSSESSEKESLMERSASNKTIITIEKNGYLQNRSRVYISQTNIAINDDLQDENNDDYETINDNDTIADNESVSSFCTALTSFKPKLSLYTVNEIN